MHQASLSETTRFAYGVPSTQCSPSRLAGFVSELQEVTGLVAAEETVRTDQLADRFRRLAAAVLGSSVSLVLPALVEAGRNAAEGHRRHGRLPEGQTWEDAEQETVLRMMERLMDLSQGPIEDIRSYAFVTMRSVLSAWKRKAAIRRTQTGTAVDLDTLPDGRLDGRPAADNFVGELEKLLAGSPTPVGCPPLLVVFHVVARHDYSLAKARAELGLSEQKVRQLWSAIVSVINSAPLSGG